MKYSAWILSILFSFPLVERYLKRQIKGKEELKKEILQKSRHLRRMMKDIERKERKVIQIKRDLVPLINKYRKM